MEDPIPLIHCVFQLCLEKNLEQIRRNPSPTFHRTHKLFHSFYSQSRGSLSGILSGQPYHNGYFNCCTSAKGRRAIHTPSQLYWFDEVETEIQCYERKIAYGETPEDCAVCITLPSKEIQGSLLSACRKISTNQRIANLYAEQLDLNDAEDADVFRFSKNAQSLTFRDCNLSYKHINNFWRQLSDCVFLRTLNLSGTDLNDVTSTNLSKMTFLEKLDLSYAKVSPEFAESVCTQLKYLVQLVELVLENIPVGSSSQNIKEAIEAWGLDPPLQVLDLAFCQIPVQMCVSLLSALSKCERLTKLNLSSNDVSSSEIDLTEAVNQVWGPFPNLEEFHVTGLRMPSSLSGPILSALSSCQNLQGLYFSGNILTGCLPNFLVGFSSEVSPLEALVVNSASLNEDDVEHITDLIKEDRLPRLKCLDMRANYLGYYSN